MRWVVPGYAEERELGAGASGRVVAALPKCSSACFKRPEARYNCPSKACASVAIFTAALNSIMNTTRCWSLSKRGKL